MEAFAEDGFELLASAVEELEAAAAWAAGVEEEVLGCFCAAEAD